MTTDPEDKAFTKNDWASEGSLNKREYFAALALQGMCSQYTKNPPINIAREAVAYAEALIIELNKEVK